MPREKGRREDAIEVTVGRSCLLVHSPGSNMAKSVVIKTKAGKLLYLNESVKFPLCYIHFLIAKFVH